MFQQERDTQVSFCPRDLGPILFETKYIGTIVNHYVFWSTSDGPSMAYNNPEYVGV